MWLKKHKKYTKRTPRRSRIRLRIKLKRNFRTAKQPIGPQKLMKTTKASIRRSLKTSRPLKKAPLKRIFNYTPKKKAFTRNKRWKWKLLGNITVDFTSIQKPYLIL